MDQCGTLFVLAVDDSADDAELMSIALDDYGLAHRSVRIDTEEEFIAQLNGPARPDVILCDHAMPVFSARRALDLLREFQLDIPFIIVSRYIGEEDAVAAMRDGASDYLLKDRVTRLGPAVQNAMDKARVRRERSAAMVALAEANERLRALSRQIIDVQEAERRRLARELHDEIGQMLTALKIDLHRVRIKLPPVYQAEFERPFETLEAMIGLVRGLALDLRPPQLDAFGLPDAIRWLAERLNAPGTVITTEFHGLRSRLPHELETVCFRVIQEALNNAIKHARASAVSVSVSRDSNFLTVRMRDDGSGFIPEKERRKAMTEGHLGLLGMEERVALLGGRFRLHSSIGQGTLVEAEFDLGEDNQKGGGEPVSRDGDVHDSGDQDSSG